MNVYYSHCHYLNQYTFRAHADTLSNTRFIYLTEFDGQNPKTAIQAKSNCIPKMLIYAYLWTYKILWMCVVCVYVLCKCIFHQKPKITDYTHKLEMPNRISRDLLSLSLFFFLSSRFYNAIIIIMIIVIHTCVYVFDCMNATETRAIPSDVRSQVWFMNPIPKHVTSMRCTNIHTHRAMVVARNIALSHTVPVYIQHTIHVYAQHTIGERHYHACSIARP